VVGVVSGSLDEQVYAGAGDLYLGRFTPGGSKVWSRLAGSAGQDLARVVKCDGANGHIYVTGNVRGTVDGQRYMGADDIVLMKYNLNGDRMWVTMLGTYGNDAGFAMVLAPNANPIWVSGYTQGPLDGQMYYGQNDVYFTAFHSNGSRAQTHQYGTNRSDVAFGLAITSGGILTVIGNTNAPEMEGQVNPGGNMINGFITTVETCSWIDDSKPPTEAPTQAPTQAGTHAPSNGPSNAPTHVPTPSSGMSSSGSAIPDINGSAPNASKPIKSDASSNLPRALLLCSIVAVVVLAL